MHPPFYTVDHKIGPDIHHFGDDRPVIRRSTPARLDLSPATPGWPPVPFLPQDGIRVQLPSGVTLAPRLHLQIVPPPQPTWRVVIGRWMIRTGQRMILQNRPG